MSETEIPDVPQEVVAPAVDEVSISQSESDNQEVDPGKEQDGETVSDRDQNFKAMRETNARLQSRLDDADRRGERMERLMEEKFAAQLAPQTEEIDELADVSADDWTTRKHVEKLAERQAKTIVKQMMAEERQVRLKEELPDRIKAKHSDFESVVTPENVKYLQANKPHVAASLSAMNDPYAQALAAYDYVQAFCPSSQVRDEEARMAKNATKPGTLGAAQAPSPLSEAKALERGLTPDLKRKYQQEMVAAMRGS